MQQVYEESLLVDLRVKMEHLTQKSWGTSTTSGRRDAKLQGGKTGRCEFDMDACNMFAWNLHAWQAVISFI